MRILVTGAKGMLGTDLCPILASAHEVKATGKKTTYLWKGKPAFSFIKDVKFPDDKIRKVTFIKDRRGGKLLWVSHNIPESK